MSAALNKVLLVGTVGRDPELRHAASGRAVATFSLGVPSRMTAGNSEATEWFNIVAWGALAESCQAQLKAGQSVFVEGRLKNRQWKDSDGQTRSATEIVADQLSPVAVQPEREQQTSQIDAGRLTMEYDQ
ncbi:MAG: single-stranded DNA-binding protein [Spongiibacter sp.]|nr:single-stranded DNA-binding protein [Spongiibacter sp.]